MTEKWSEQPSNTAVGNGSRIPEDVDAALDASAPAAGTEEAPAPTAAGSDPAPATDEASEPAPPADPGSAFLADLAQAMHATAGAERVRVAEDTEERRQAYISEIRARQTDEADQMRNRADDELRAIDAWADGEIARIRREQQRRATDLNQNLDANLAEHGARIDGEIERVEAAIAAYRTELDRYFARLERESDVVLIAQHAIRRPEFPSLEAAAAEPTGEPASEPGGSGSESNLVGVMDPQAARDEPVTPWVASAEAGDDDRGDDTGSSEEDFREESPNQLLQSIPARRPMSWLRRDKDDDH